RFWRLYRCAAYRHLHAGSIGGYNRYDNAASDGSCRYRNGTYDVLPGRKRNPDFVGWKRKRLVQWGYDTIYHRNRIGNLFSLRRGNLRFGDVKRGRSYRNSCWSCTDDHGIGPYNILSGRKRYPDFIIRCRKRMV